MEKAAISGCLFNFEYSMMGVCIMPQTKTREMALTAMLAAVAVVGGMFIVIPTPFARCVPVQHLVNVLCAVLLGPKCGVTAAFLASTIRNILGIGTLVAYPGSMCGAFLSAFLYQRTHSLMAAVLGEIIGTGIIGALLAYPVSAFLLGNASLALYAFIVPFLVSTGAGALAAGALLYGMEKSGVLSKLSADR